MRWFFGRAVDAAAPAMLLASCNGVQSALDPRGPTADELARMFWVFVVICAAVWIVVSAVLVLTLVAQRRPRPDPMSIEPMAERMLQRSVIFATGATMIVLVALTLLSFFANRTLAVIDQNADLTIRVTGHQWWWEVRYESDDPARVLTTANQIHLPAGEPVRVLLQSADVIHSFWVPSLHGKLDLIPGVVNSLTLKADKPGVYRGQCAEFCGLQHAHMSTFVIAEPRVVFDAWYRSQLEHATDVASVDQDAGR